jgi:hypothetical protein
MDQGTTVKVQIERRAGHLGVEMPVRFRFDARVVEIVDQWYGPDYCYFKIKGNDGNLYILRFDEGCAEWELMMFQSPGPHSTHYPEGSGMSMQVTPDVRGCSLH